MAVISASVPPVDVQVVQGTTLTFSVTWTDAGVPQPLTGLSARASFAPRKGATAWFTLTVGSGLTLEPGGATGQIDVVVTPAQTKAVTADGFWDLILYDATKTNVKRLLEGAVIVDKSVTEVPA